MTGRTIGSTCPTAVAALFLAMSLSACAPLPWQTLSVSHEDAVARGRHDVAPPSTTGFAPANATPARRQDTLDRVWRTIEEKHYDADLVRRELPALVVQSTSQLATVASDADFYRVLQRNVGAMEDSHTLVLTPREAEAEHAQRSTAIGIEYDLVENRLVVTGVVDGFPAAKQGVRRGMIVARIDDQPIDDAFLAAAARGDAKAEDRGDESWPERRQLTAVWKLFGGDDEAPRVHRVTLLRADDTTLQVDLLAQDGDVPTVEALDRLPSGIDVLRLSRFDPSVMPRLSGDLARAGADSRALILDLRHDPGGDIDMFMQLVDGFIEEPVALGRVTFRLWSFDLGFTLDGTPVARPYRQPIAVLVDESTGSAAEMTAHALAELRGAIVVGTPTCGCVVGLLREFSLPDGGVLRVAEVGVRSPHGRRMENDPLQPALPVTPTLAQIRTGDDVVLQVAERALATASSEGSR